MKEELVFRECQHLKLWWSVPLSIINVLLIYGCIRQLAFGKSFGNNPMPDTGFIIFTVVMVLMNVLFLFARLNTAIDKEGVYVQMFPFHLRFKFIPWERIDKVDVRKTYYISIGLHYGFGATSYTMGGNKVLRLTLNNKKKIDIGTRRREELTEFLSKLDAERKQK